MRQRVLWMAAFLWIACGVAGFAQEDFLDSLEVSAMRDTQEPDKRLILWMDIAQHRVDRVKEQIETHKAEAGPKIQKALSDYVHVMEGLQDTIDDARERRVPLTKGFKDVETRGNLLLNYLRTLHSEAIPGYKDFKYTLEEALDMTRDELAEVAKGNYPETQQRKPPTDLPPSSARPPSKPQNPPPSEPAADGPPRKSQQRP
jgi:hypothetical protein